MERRKKGRGGGKEEESMKREKRNREGRITRNGEKLRWEEIRVGR